MLYSTNPQDFNEEDVDFIESVNKDVGIDFNRDMAVSESNVGSVLNQFASGVAEGFNTLGWAEEARHYRRYCKQTWTSCWFCSRYYY